MKVLILGGDGYLGWPTAMYFSARGFQVGVVDNYFRRRTSRDLAIPPLHTVPELTERARIWREKTGRQILTAIGDITDYAFLQGCFTGEVFGESGSEMARPDAVLHYAEQPSAPYSMMGREEAVFTLRNNLIGTCNLIHAVRELQPDCHIIKIGTMGVYGTPNIDIEEGYLRVEHKGRSHTFLYPRTPGSMYHLTKVQDGDMLYFYCRTWKLRATDLNQGPVYGIFTPETDVDGRLATIFNYDAVFGTVLNRFLCQAAVGHPLTVYGKGDQARGFLNINDTLQCVLLAMQNPAAPGEYRVYNQFVETFTVNELAEKVCRVGAGMGLNVRIEHLDNPRLEAEDHYYNPVHTGLLELGLQPHFLSNDLLAEMMEYVLRQREKIDPSLFAPTVRWA